MLPLNQFNFYFHFYETAYRIDETHIQSSYSFQSTWAWSHHSLLLDIAEAGDYVFNLDTPMLYNIHDGANDDLTRIEAVIQDTQGVVYSNLNYYD